MEDLKNLEVDPLSNFDEDYNITDIFSNETTTIACRNDYCVSDSEYEDMIKEYIFPKPSEWVLISLHITVFVVGLIGNALVCLSVYRNHTMRTVTNYFIVNLAFADFLVILICLPPTVLWDVTETWFFGRVTCKLVLYLQNVSVSVSVLTLTFISIDRWYAICHPLKFKSTASRARTSIFIIWTVSMLIVLPEAIVLDTIPARIKFKFPPSFPPYFTDCNYTWAKHNTRVYQLFLIAVLYVAPFSLMGVSYYQITKVLWSKNNIPGSMEVNNHSSFKHDDLSKVGRNGAARISNVTCEGQIKSRRKASKMLIAVVVIFIICYFPVHLINSLRYTVGIPQTNATTMASLISHWLCYANSAMNPIIYNIMNGKFRKEFRNVFTCRCLKSSHGVHRRKGTLYLCRYTSTVAAPSVKHQAQHFS